MDPFQISHEGVVYEITVRFEPARKGRAVGASDYWYISIDGEPAIRAPRADLVQPFAESAVRDRAARPTPPSTPVTPTPARRRRPTFEPRPAETVAFTTPGYKRGRCTQCDTWSERLIPTTDMSGIPGHLCFRCHRGTPTGLVSFS